MSNQENNRIISNFLIEIVNLFNNVWNREFFRRMFVSRSSGCQSFDLLLENISMLIFHRYDKLLFGRG